MEQFEKLFGTCSLSEPNAKARNHPIWKQVKFNAYLTVNLRIRSSTC